jgi:hypothetical protein
MSKYGISSFLVIAQKQPEDSPRLGRANKKIITGILTNRDIKCFESSDEKVQSRMTPMERLVYYEVDYHFDPNNCDLNSLINNCK